MAYFAEINGQLLASLARCRYKQTAKTRSFHAGPGNLGWLPMALTNEVPNYSRRPPRLEPDAQPTSVGTPDVGQQTINEDRRSRDEGAIVHPIHKLDHAIRFTVRTGEGFRGV